MKKFNRGFTIAEVATAMAIVGVIAAITIPMLHKNIQKQVYAATLARTVEQIELGCQNLLEYENSKRTDGSVITMLREIEGFSMEKLAPFIGFKEDGSDSSYLNDIKKYAYIPTYTLGSPVYAALNADVVKPQRIDEISSKFLEDGGGSGGGGGSSSSSTTTSTEEDNNDDTTTSEDEAIIIEDYSSSSEDVIEDSEDTTTTVEAEPIVIKKDPLSMGNPFWKIYKTSSGKQCIQVTNAYANKTEPTDTIMEFVIDTNGTQSKTNMYGKDVFKFELLNNGKVKPFGNADNCKTGAVGDGTACAARIVADGWKIKY